MAINFNAQFIVNEKTATRVLRLTDTSTGFTLAKGNFSVTFPDGSQVIHTDFTSPDISAPGGFINIALITDIDNTVLTGTYVVNFVAINAALTEFTLQRNFDFNWEKPVKIILNQSDVVIPTITFRDSTAYETSGNFTGTLTRNFYTTTPSTSEVGVITKTSVGDVLTPSNASKYYEGIYLVKSDISVAYTHSSLSWLTVLYVDLLEETYDIREAPTQNELVTLMNEYKDQIEEYKTTNPAQYELLNEEYDLVIALYSHIVARFDSGTLAGCKPILDQLLGLLPPTEPYTYKATQMLPFTLTAHDSVSWGAIIGTLSSQTDLQAALDAKIAGSGTVNYVPKFTSTSVLGNSNIQDSGSLITLGSNTTISSGGLGIGTSTLTGYSLRVAKNITGATSSFGISQESVIQSDVTSAARMYNSNPSTAASAFTLASLQHYTAQALTLGAGSAVTNQFGFLVLANMIGATNNYAFNGQLANAANTWNLYMAGSAPNYMVGALGIGTTSLTSTSLRVGRNITGAASSISVLSEGAIQSDVTTQGIYYSATGSTAAAAFTLPNIFYYNATQATFGAGSTVTAQTAFNVSAALIGATINYGFRSQIPSGIGRWNLFMDGTADNYLAGNANIGGASSSVSAGPILTVTLTNGGSGYVDGTYTDVPVILISTGGAYALFTVTVASGIVTTATLTWGGSNYKVGDTISISPSSLGGTGSGLVLTIATVEFSQLKVSSALTAGTDVSIYRSSTSLNAGNPYGSLKWEGNDSSTKSSGVAAKITAYAPGAAGGAYLSLFTSAGNGGALTEQVRISQLGSVGIGGAYGLTQYVLRVSKNITGSTASYGVTSDGVIQSDVTSQAHYFSTTASTQATAFTLGSLYHFRAIQGTIGAGSTLTNQYGVFIDATLIGATNNYGFFGNIAAGINRWNLHMLGTADNYLGGNTGIGNSSNFVGAGAILTTTLTNGGSGYVDGTYTDVVSSNISSNGVYALFTIIVSGGIVTTATLTWGGTTYKVGDTLNISNTLLGGAGSGLVITVATVDSSILTIASTTGSDITLYRNDTSSTLGDNIGTIKWESRDATIKSSGIGAEIGAFSAGATGGAYLSLSTRSASAGTSLVEAMRIGSEGNVGIGATAFLGYSLRVSKDITGSTSTYGIVSDGEIQSGVTTQATYIQSNISTVSASFTISNIRHFRALQGTIGVGSTVTTQIGYEVDSSLIGATNNYGFRGAIPSGTNRWNIYMDGTAQNYLAGALSIGVTTANASALLQIDSTTQGFLPPRMTAAQRTAISSPATGLIVFQTDGVEGLWLRVSTGWVELTVV